MGTKESTSKPPLRALQTKIIHSVKQNQIESPFPSSLLPFHRKTHKENQFYQVKNPYLGQEYSAYSSQCFALHSTLLYSTLHSALYF